MLWMARVSPRVQSSSLRHSDRVGQLRMCQSVSVRWMQAGHLSCVALLIRCMCRSASWKKIMGKFDDEDFGAVLQSVKGFSWDLPVDGVEGMSGPVVPFHEFLAKSWAASCFSESLGDSSCDCFNVDSEAGFGGWNERDDFGWF